MWHTVLGQSCFNIKFIFLCTCLYDIVYFHLLSTCVSLSAVFPLTRAPLVRQRTALHQDASSLRDHQPLARALGLLPLARHQPMRRKGTSDLLLHLYYPSAAQKQKKKKKTGSCKCQFYDRIYRFGLKAQCLSLQIVTISPSEGLMEPGESRVCRVTFFSIGEPSFYDIDLVCEVRMLVFEKTQSALMEDKISTSDGVC